MVFSIEFLFVILAIGININSTIKEKISFIFGIIWALVFVFYYFYDMSTREYRKSVKKFFKGRLSK